MSDETTIGVSVEEFSRYQAVLMANVRLGEVRMADLEWAHQDPQEAGRQWTLFLLNGGRVIVNGGIITLSTTPFDPVNFKGLGKGWKLIEEEDPRMLALTMVDTARFCFETTLNHGETSIAGEERIIRLKRDHATKIRAGARLFLHSWNNQSLIPEDWKTRGAIFFDGTILESPRGRRYTLCLYWDGKQWSWHCYWLDRHRDAGSPSLLLVE